MTITIIDLLEARRYEVELAMSKIMFPFKEELAEIDRALAAIGYKASVTADEQRPVPA